MGLESNDSKMSFIFFPSSSSMSFLAISPSKGVTLSCSFASSVAMSSLRRSFLVDII